ncbi:LysR substrate-binding domain-containing protein [Scleromatobacter humisilvae]|uniref:LysR substrate-binding domain-containing protein n=1 Tax=Scleromatobacter humisilvae TaxID=2897159 RepID=A0A9X2C287_9BURK|nr:LysR substrate-binding domain-containing protein [Scleromatobacter humisilvae]MCK9688426.1 LysR substrate-binding domain-containing protein [Scleromatobacter humisilvae]
MELRHLRYFVAVAEELHFTRAALRLNMAQPPLSQQIRALEDELGVQLFARTRRSVALTDAGHALLERARSLLAGTQALPQELQRVARGEVGLLRIGFSSTLPLTKVLRDVVADHRRSHPDVALNLREMHSQLQFDSLRRGELDVGLVRYNEGVPEGISLRLLRRDPLRLVVPAGHRFARRKSVAIAECRDEAFIGFPGDAGTGTGPLLKRLAAQAGFEPRIAQEAREATTQIGLVAAGLGIAVLPAPLEAVRIEGVHYVALEGKDALLVMSVATRADEASERVLSFVRRVAAMATVRTARSSSSV